MLPPLSVRLLRSHKFLNFWADGVSTKHLELLVNQKQESGLDQSSETNFRSFSVSFFHVFPVVWSKIPSICSFGVLVPLVSSFGMAAWSARRNSSRPG